MLASGRVKKILAFVVILLAVAHARADQLFSSANLSSTGQNGGFVIGGGQWPSVRFQLASAKTIDHVGGHMLANNFGNNLIFAAIVQLSSDSDFPNSSDLSTSDVLAHTTFSANLNSSTDLSVPIGPINAAAGNYALVFGSGHFGATGQAAMPNDNPLIDTPSFMVWQGVGGWQNGASQGVRFTVSGSVPEPAMGLNLLIFAGMLRRKRA